MTNQLTVGIMSSLYPPVCTGKLNERNLTLSRIKYGSMSEIIENQSVRTAITLTSDVFPAFWSPIKDSSISCLKKRLKTEGEVTESQT